MSESSSQSSFESPSEGEHQEPDLANTGYSSSESAPEIGPAPGLYAPSLVQQIISQDDSLQNIVHRLMNPPQWLYSPDGATVTLRINWAVGVVGVEHFDYVEDPDTDRHSLCLDSELATNGLELGLSEVVLAWLKDGEDNLVLPATHFRSATSKQAIPRSGLHHPLPTSFCSVIGLFIPNLAFREITKLDKTKASGGRKISLYSTPLLNEQ
ncbi:uncharacterized protein BDR25DRAFT_362676 [Lindgomyces ingoldianus]|uniref:Uncharacterized protein n=1 Tax=Lindgomyces ingoldianus TaxID=673940 RepID=A0ACB6Q962_9PLEO|nr:uncharacterized protein BDR25DRAFT_362676 [Lindgomyces ingoldianus]KAF2463503.1 hypothetical protein BDR25DRAFT_362676 [Lindgomyces ingoldianus]